MICTAAGCAVAPHACARSARASQRTNVKHSGAAEPAHGRGGSEDLLRTAHGGPAGIGAHPTCTLHLNRATEPEPTEESAVVRLPVLPSGGGRTLESGRKAAECDGVEVTCRMLLRSAPGGAHHVGVPPAVSRRRPSRAPGGVLVWKTPRRACTAVKEPEHTREERPRREAPQGEIRNLRRRTLRLGPRTVPERKPRGGERSPRNECLPLEDSTRENLASSAPKQLRGATPVRRVRETPPSPPPSKIPERISSSDEFDVVPPLVGFRWRNPEG